MEFVYSTHKTLTAAQAALENYYATGEVVESEVVGIKRRKTGKGVRFDVKLRG